MTSCHANELTLSSLLTHHQSFHLLPAKGSRLHNSTLIAPHLRLPGSKWAFAEMFKRKSVIFRVNKSHDVACARQQGYEMDFPAKSSSRSSAEERERDGRTHPIHADSLAKTINFFIATCESHNRLVNINLHALDGLSRLVNGFQWLIVVQHRSHVREKP
jgi:hypothetical protein